MNSIEIAKNVRSEFFIKIEKEIGDFQIKSSKSVIISGKYGLQIDDWSLKANDDFIYGIRLMYPIDAKYNVVEIDPYVSVDEAFASVGSMLELEHLILTNYGLREGKLDLDSIETSEDKDSND